VRSADAYFDVAVQPPPAARSSDGFFIDALPPKTIAGKTLANHWLGSQ
jgi:hypothetical protein